MTSHSYSSYNTSSTFERKKAFDNQVFQRRKTTNSSSPSSPSSSSSSSSASSLKTTQKSNNKQNIKRDEKTSQKTLLDKKQDRQRRGGEMLKQVLQREYQGFSAIKVAQPNRFTTFEQTVLFHQLLTIPPSCTVRSYILPLFYSFHKLKIEGENRSS